MWTPRNLKLETLSTSDPDLSLIQLRKSGDIVLGATKSALRGLSGRIGAIILSPYSDTSVSCFKSIPSVVSFTHDYSKN